MSRDLAAVSLILSTFGILMFSLPFLDQDDCVFCFALLPIFELIWIARKLFSKSLVNKIF